ncbi:aldose 1-epimerase family protein [Liquorilactobacillus sicerae]|uniref:aldose 1-epimerase family protein n=1 Tax=Liquorilactobacillus sicerae TaxID=1416943 RepID=UPI00247FDB8C|nr:aldose 1-epimerase family protein [Liquorilactobacillus sicerae]
MIKIENNTFQAVIDLQGAQLTHLYNKKFNFDYLWNNPAWNKHAPILFPAIGRSNHDEYLLNGEKYSMPQHGFIAAQQFEVSNLKPNIVTLRAEANAETRKMYPFEFELEVTFALLTNGLALTFAVKNNSAESMPFSLGSHPAFNVPLNDEGTFNDYRLSFTGNFQLPLANYEIIKTPAPYRTGKIEKFSASKTITLNHDLFAQGLRIIANQQVKQVELTSTRSSHAVLINLGDFKNVCLWTKETKNLPFLCIEPFSGLPDVLGEPVDWQHKEASQQLGPKQKQLLQYEILLK